MAYPIVNIDRMHGTDNMADLRSVKFGSFSGSVFTPAALPNGSIVVLGAAIDHEMYYATAPASGAKFEDLYLVASPEFLPNPLEQALENFTNPAGAAARAYKLQNGDCFSITPDGVDGGASAQVGNAVYAQASNTQMKIGSGAIQIGTVSRIEVKGGKTWLVIDVKYVAA